MVRVGELLLKNSRFKWISLTLLGGLAAKPYMPYIKNTMRNVHLKDEDIIFIIGLAFF